MGIFLREYLITRRAYPTYGGLVVIGINCDLTPGLVVFHKLQSDALKPERERERERESKRERERDSTYI